MKKQFYYLTLIASALSLTSCSTVFTGTSDNITVNSTPAGAKVFDKGLEKCVTPCTLKVNRSLSDKTITIKKEGYQDKTIELDRKFNGISILNFFGIIGWGIDAATGAMMKYDTKGYDVKLDAEKE